MKLEGNYPARPAFGTGGKAIVVYANYMKLIPQAKDVVLHRYSVAIAPEVRGRKLKRVYELLLQDPALAGVATENGGMIVSRQALDISIPFEKEIVYIAEGETEPKEKPDKYMV